MVKLIVIGRVRCFLTNNKHHISEWLCKLCSTALKWILLT